MHRWDRSSDRSTTRHLVRHRLWRWLHIAASVLFIVGGLSACTVAIAGEGLAKVNLSQTDNGKTITLKLGEDVVLQLEENPTTGFRWEFEQRNDEILQLIGTDYVPHGTGLGRGGERIFRFKASKRGNAHVVLKLWRPWQGDVSVHARYEVSFRIVE